MKKFWQWRNNFIKKNTMLSVYIAFFKGVVFTVLIYEFLLKL